MNLKYLHVAQRITPEMKNALEEIPRRGGFYNWMFVFKGGITSLREIQIEPKQLEDYDVIQLNLSPVDQLLVQEVRRLLPKSSSTMVFGNNDYVCESWDMWNQHPYQYEQTQELCDAVFGTEPHQVSNMIEGAYCIPHPHWTKMLKHLGNDNVDPERITAGFLYHWWEGRSYNASLLFQKLKRKYPRLFTKMYAYTGQYDRSKMWQKILFDKHMPLMNYPNFIQSLMSNNFVLEQSHYHTYGRTSVDTAALRVPTMGTNRVFSMQKCWPNMIADPLDLKKQYEIADKILQGGKWLDEQMDYAYDAVEYFNYDNAKKRYLKMYEETKKRLGK